MSHKVTIVLPSHLQQQPPTHTTAPLLINTAHTGNMLCWRVPIIIRITFIICAHTKKHSVGTFLFLPEVSYVSSYYDIITSLLYIECFVSASEQIAFLSTWHQQILYRIYFYLLEVHTVTGTKIYQIALKLVETYSEHIFLSRWTTNKCMVHTVKPNFKLIMKINGRSCVKGPTIKLHGNMHQ